MKKIYSSAWLAMLLLIVHVSRGQNACPGPNPPVVRNLTYFVNGQQVCAVYVEHMLPNAPVTLFGPNLTVIPTTSGQVAVTDGTGFACHVFPCHQVPVRVSTCNAKGCCTALVPAATIVPVRLTRFTAKLSPEQEVTLDWTSVTELNSNTYVVERSSDGRNFIAVGIVKAAGNSAHAINYQFRDKPAGAGAYFYRLNQVDVDGKSEFSKVVYINSGKSTGVVSSVFPNPFQSDIQLVGINTGDLNSKNVRVFNVAGQQVNYRISGANAIAIDHSYPKGVYILKVKDQTFKIIKQ